MLVDIFARRYAAQPLWTSFGENERRLLVQSFRLLEEQVAPYYDSKGNATDAGKAFWNELQSRLSMELGLKSLSALNYSYQTAWNGNHFTQTGTWPMTKVCENWFMADLPPGGGANRYFQERLSLIEIGFRMREENIREINAELDTNISNTRKWQPVLGGTDIGDIMRTSNTKLNSEFYSAVEELNVRFRQAECDLHYHNGFIQIGSDSLTTEQVQAPFWSIVAAPRWKNVDTDMKEAIDRRDTGGRDPAFYAACALESTIKIISTAKGWTHGNEKGAHNFIDNLGSKKAGFIDQWEVDALKWYFTKIRNPLGHGPGDQPMVALSPEQTTFAIESAMMWIKSLIRRSSL